MKFGFVVEDVGDMAEAVFETIFTNFCDVIGRIAIEEIKKTPDGKELVRRYHEDEPQDPDVVLRFEELHCAHRQKAAALFLESLADHLREDASGCEEGVDEEARNGRRVKR